MRKLIVLTALAIVTVAAVGCGSRCGRRAWSGCNPCNTCNPCGSVVAGDVAIGGGCNNCASGAVVPGAMIPGAVDGTIIQPGPVIQGAPIIQGAPVIQGGQVIGGAVPGSGAIVTPPTLSPSPSN